jgi:hypothetical protein
MNDLGESVPSMETKKKKRGSGFRYSSKKAIECSRLSKKTTKAGGSEFTTITKALTCSSALSSEIDHLDCVSGGRHLLDSVLKADGVRVESSFANIISDHLMWVCSN